MSLPILPGAEPWSHDGGPLGALCVHGFTGSPSSMRPVAEAFASAGFTVELPRLPGHGTTVDDMMATGWADWTAAVAEAHARLAARTERLVVAGLSMGGALSLWLAAQQPSLAGVVAINPATQAQPEIADLARDMIAGGTTAIPGIGSDIAKEGVVEVAYESTPLAPLLSLMEGLADLQGRYGACRQPLLLMSSPQDHVVVPEQSDFLAGAWGGPVERLSLERSYHVATQDHDAELIQEQAVAFARRVCSTTAR
jgi:carboxylesterase